MAAEHSFHTNSAGQSWSRVFPLATGAPDADAPIKDLDGSARQALAASAAATARVHDQELLEQHFPLMKADTTDITELRLDPRSFNALTRSGIRTIGDLGQQSARDLISLRQAGKRTVRSITNKLAWWSVQRTASNAVIPDDIELQTTSQDVGAVLGPELTDSLRDVAGWHVLRGQPDARLWSDAGLEGAPPRVLDAWARLQELRADNVLGADAPSPAAVLNELLSGEDPRNVQILERRLFADHAETLDAIGQDLDITRERVRQLLVKSTARLQSEVTGKHEGLADLGAALRQRIGVVSSLDRVLAVYPSLRDNVPVVGKPAWRIIDRLDDSFEIADGWAAVPTVNEAQRRTRELVREYADELGTASVASVASALGIDVVERADEFHQWLRFVDLPCFQERVVTQANSIPDWAVVVLAHEGRPLSAPEIAERMPITRTEASIRNACATDERIARVDRRSFGLAVWGLETYSGIRELIGRYLDSNGGSADLEELVSELTDKFDVADNSVRAYASSFPYELRHGQVTRQDPDAPSKEGNLRAARRSYATPDGVGFRFEVTADHWRGSGSVIPTDLARCIGLREGDSITLPCSDGDQAVYWTGLQPSIGSVKRLVEHLSIQPGEWAMAVFGTEGDFVLRRIDLAGLSGLSLAQSMTGTEHLPPGDARVAIAIALSLPAESGWSSIIAAARDRGEDDLVAALMSDPVVSADDGTAPPSTISDEGVTVDDILDLL